ncbi:MAG TPA: histidine--tRNA ligase [Acidimicrobiales bacterium]|nr:histidine--tRNA ligase [Acidimicrobiales bacterium]
MAEEQAPLRAPVGTKDVLWPESDRWMELVARFARRVRRAGYGLALTPLFEEARLFRRAVGEHNDVVGKEMYEFDDRGGRHMALRPEGTAPVVRAFVQHHPPVPWKAWYVTPAFRYERPQAGRYRQHHQLGVEALGTDDADLDVEVVALAAGFYDELGLRQVTLAVNSMGCAECRPAYVAALTEYLTSRRHDLCDEHKDRFERNPLRVLDCKRPACRQATAEAPRMVDFLDPQCASHFERVRGGLGALGIEHHLEPRLVRGLDYYTRTTFEFAATALDTAQNAVGGGGRYNGLAEAIGGGPTPGIGFGIGIERLLLACDAEGCFSPAASVPDAFVVDVTGGEMARDLAEELRRAGLAAERAYDGRSLKSQLKAADRSGAAVAVIVGPDEVAAGTVTLRGLRHQGAQEQVPRRVMVERVTAMAAEIHTPETHNPER